MITNIVSLRRSNDALAALVLAISASSSLAQPARTAAEVNTTRGPVVVSGVVPDESSRQIILGRVREIYGAAHVVDQLGVATSSAPPLWAEQVKKMVTSDLRSIQRGHLRVTGHAVELVGQTETAAIKGKIGAILVGSVNPTYTVNNQLQVLESPQTRVDSVLAGKIVEFEFNSTVLSATGRAVLDELLPVLETLDGRKVQIVGHTDAAGSRASNLQLSQERANAVKIYLRAKGLALTNVMTSGAGSDQPIASNASAEGQAKNRRIEFRVLP